MVDRLIELWTRFPERLDIQELAIVSSAIPGVTRIFKVLRDNIDAVNCLRAIISHVAGYVCATVVREIPLYSLGSRVGDIYTPPWPRFRSRLQVPIANMQLLGGSALLLLTI